VLFVAVVAVLAGIFLFARRRGPRDD